MLTLITLFLFQVLAVTGNTEKTIFLGPSKLQIPTQHPTLEDLHLDILTPLDGSLRTHLQAEFPTEVSKYGQSSWFLLNGLQEGQRYEVRVCWAAIQPTSFRMETYELPVVFETPDLITSLATYSESLQPDAAFETKSPVIVSANLKSKHLFEESSSILFLRIQAAADYYTMNQTLMEQVPPVFVDIILDPFIFNIFPQSLLSTALYIVILAIGSWFLSKHIGRWFSNISSNIESEKKAQ